MPEILVTYPVDKKIRNYLIDTLAASGDVTFLTDIPKERRTSEISAADVLMAWNLKRELKPSELPLISNARLLQVLSAGVDHLPISKIPLPVTIASNAGAYGEPMAEHVVAMILAIYKNLLDRHNKLVKGVFDQSQNRRLEGCSCAILGFGGIGKACARRLHCLGVRIFALNTSGKTNDPVEFVGTIKDLEYVLRLADIVIVSIPLTKATRNLIGSTELGWMKDDATIVNVARGDIINEKALYERLKIYPGFNAAIDTWWAEPFGGGRFHQRYPFLKLPNVLGSPHDSGNVPEIMSVAVTYAAENVKRFLKGEQISGLVNRSDYD